MQRSQRQVATLSMLSYCSLLRGDGGLRRSRFEQPSIHFAAIVFWQTGHEFDPARILVERDSGFNKFLDLIGEFFAWFASLPRDDKRLWLHQAIAFFIADDRAFHYRRML